MLVWFAFANCGIRSVSQYADLSVVWYVPTAVLIGLEFESDRAKTKSLRADTETFFPDARLAESSWSNFLCVCTV